jgi:Na+/phosphate symporter
MEEQFNCPRCGSDRTQKAKILYEAGASAIKVTTVGVDGVGVELAATAGSSQTELSKNLSPPVKPKKSRAGWLLFTMGIVIILPALPDIPEIPRGGVTLAYLVIGGGLMFLGGWLNKKSTETFKKADLRYQVDYPKWERLWFCNRCGHAFYMK